MKNYSKFSKTTEANLRQDVDKNAEKQAALAESGQVAVESVKTAVQARRFRGRPSRRPYDTEFERTGVKDLAVDTYSEDAKANQLAEDQQTVADFMDNHNM